MLILQLFIILQLLIDTYIFSIKYFWMSEYLVNFYELGLRISQLKHMCRWMMV